MSAPRSSLSWRARLRTAPKNIRVFLIILFPFALPKRNARLVLVVNAIAMHIAGIDLNSNTSMCPLATMTNGDADDVTGNHRCGSTSIYAATRPQLARVISG